MLKNLNDNDLTNILGFLNISHDNKEDYILLDVTNNQRKKENKHCVKSYDQSQRFANLLWLHPALDQIILKHVVVQFVF